MPKIEYVTDKILTKIGINKNEIMIKDINESIKDKVVQIEEISKDIKEINKLLTSIEYKPDKELLEIFNNEIQKDILKELNKIQEEQKRLDQAYKNIIKKR
ncbi:hypothetical protein K502DRAFT_242073 [Neoconidiobolus thromboides FSU 785]|nr:hypothetical protein K502DRAFT_242073 [Neoconidiobolus thromboides FSU 785]